MRRDMVFDHPGNYLYISTSDGFVRRYNLASDVLEPGYNLGGSLNGLDIAPDDSFLLIAQNSVGISQGTFQRLNLKDGTVTNIGYVRTSYELGGWDVKIGSREIALVTTRFNGSGPVPLRQINLATNTAGIRTDAPGSSVNGYINQDTPLYRGADGTRICVVETNSSGPLFTYDAILNTFSPGMRWGTYLDRASAAFNRNGSVLATRVGSSVCFDRPPTFEFLRALRNIDGGIAFDATQDRFYGVNSVTDQIIAFDASNYMELYRLPIGDDVASGVTKFSMGDLVASPDGRFLALATPGGIRLFTLPLPPYAPPPAPAFSSSRDMVFDHTGQRLYMTTADGFVWPYDVASGTLGTPYNIGGSPSGLDIAPDDSYLLVAQRDWGVAQGALHKIDLTSGVITNLPYNRSTSESGVWDVAIVSNGVALATTGYIDAGWMPMRQFNLTTYEVTKRTDAPGSGSGGGVYNRTQIHRSADGTRLYFLESAGRLFTYSALSNTFGLAANTGTYHDSTSAAVSRTGSLLATRLSGRTATIDTAPNLGFLRALNALDGGVAFDAVSDTVYGVSSFGSQIIAYDTNNFVERFRFDIGENVGAGGNQFSAGVMVASPDGRHLALQTPNAIRVFDVPAVQLTSVASEVTHGGTSRGVDLPLDGPRAIEPRTGGGERTYTMVFTFGQSLTEVGTASVTSGSANILSSMIDPADPRRYRVNLQNVANRQYVKVTLGDVFDVLGNHTAAISQQMGVLIGDTNGDATVNSSDALQTRNRSGQNVTAANFRSDVNGDGTINGGDAVIVRLASGNAIP